jgi:DNA-binding transcriptional MerR regulator
VTSTARYAIGDLARLAGVSRRTVRYYVQEGLIPPPLGVGRGNHYSPDHLEEILRVKALQEAGKSLDEIKRPSPGQQPDSAAGADERPALQRAIWRRITMAPGVELHLADNVRLPSPGRLQELADWCGRHLTATPREREEDDDR